MVGRFAGAYRKRVKALFVVVALVVTGWVHRDASPSAACQYGRTPPPASVADAVLRSDRIVIGDLFAPPGPVDFLDAIRVGRAIMPADDSEPIGVLLESVCGDRLPHFEAGRYVAFLRQVTTPEGKTEYPKLAATFVPIRDGFVSAQSLSGVALELNGRTEEEAAAYIADVASRVSPGMELVPPIGEPSQTFRTPAVITPRRYRKNSDLHGLLRGHGAILLGEVDQSRPVLYSDRGQPPVLVTRHRIRVQGWLRRPLRSHPNRWVLVDQPGARFGDVLFETEGDALMQPGERYLFILQNLQTPDGGEDTGTLVPGLRLRIDDAGRLQPVDPIWLRYGGIRELANLPVLAGVMRIRAAMLNVPGR